MRTKTLALSAILGALGTAAALAQSTNVYSINSVGYINTTFPASSYTILTCPLICGTDPNNGVDQHPQRHPQRHQWPVQESESLCIRWWNLHCDGERRRNKY